jgi:uncharacterized protein YkwD
MAVPRSALLVKLIAPLCLAVALFALLSAISTPNAKSRDGRFRWKKTEKCFMRKINHHRLRHGRHRIHWDRQLTYVARRHAYAMAKKGGGIWHDGYLGQKVTRWRSLGQNTGRGQRCKTLFKAFWRSSAHRANILGKWRFQGVGVATGNGRIYVQQVFESRTDPGNIYSFP